jgi:hypothetical protein
MKTHNLKAHLVVCYMQKILFNVFPWSLCCYVINNNYNYVWIPKSLSLLSFARKLDNTNQKNVMLDIGEHIVVKGNLCTIEEDSKQKIRYSFQKWKGSSHGQSSPIRKKASMNVALSKKKISTRAHMKEDMLGPIGTTHSKKTL